MTGLDFAIGPNQNLSRALRVAGTSFFFLIASIGFSAPGNPGISSNALEQIRALQADKQTRTPAQQKLDSQLIYAARQRLNQPISPGVPSLRVEAQIRVDGKCLVDITGAVDTELLQAVNSAGGEVLNSSPRFGQMRAWLPLDQAEALASRSDVRFVRPAVGSTTWTGSLNSEGEITHTAGLARTNFGVNGSGVKVGVLSDSIDYLAQSQSTDDLPANLVVLPGQEGSGAGEGTAMLEIIHDLAPGAQLYFATGNSGPAQYAQNILDLRAAGCDIILDDLFYFNESPFQDGLIAQAVNTVTAAGAWFFSAAGNEGNLTHETSGAWEGDFADGGAVDSPVDGKGGRLHSFGGTNYNEVLQRGLAAVLFWSDPEGASTNDYDLYVLDATGSYVVSSSTTTQNGSQDPYEIAVPFAGERLVVVKASGAGRFLHIDTVRGRLALGTAGSLKGHAATTNALAVAAVDVSASFPNPFSGGVTNPVELTSTDGPRRVFFHQNGAAITPGNFSATGGYVRRKPDIAAADGVQTTVPGFNPFFGTSAAAPHAAAIAALLKSFRPNLTAAGLRAALTNTALDIETAGWDRDSGAGIVMALAALHTLVAPAVLSQVGLTNGHLRFTLTGETNHNYGIEASTNLTTWTSISTNTTAGNGTFQFVDPATVSSARRFFRARRE